MKPTKRDRGFSLIELVVAVGILAILSAIAIPVYTQYRLKSHRGNAKAVLLEEARQLERYFSQNNTYEDAELGKTQTTGGTYTIQFENAKGDGSNSDTTEFTVEAVPLGGQASDDCGTLSLDSLGRKLPADCW